MCFLTRIVFCLQLVLENFFGLSGPAKLPADIVTRINAACNEVLAMPDIKKRLIDLGITAVPASTATSGASSIVFGARPVYEGKNCV